MQLEQVHTLSVRIAGVERVFRGGGVLVDGLADRFVAVPQGGLELFRRFRGELLGCRDLGDEGLDDLVVLLLRELLQRLEAFDELVLDLNQLCLDVLARLFAGLWRQQDSCDGSRYGSDRNAFDEGLLFHDDCLPNVHSIGMWL